MKSGMFVWTSEGKSWVKMKSKGDRHPEKISVRQRRSNLGSSSSFTTEGNTEENGLSPDFEGT